MGSGEGVVYATLPLLVRVERLFPIYPQLTTQHSITTTRRPHKCGLKRIVCTQHYPYLRETVSNRPLAHNTTLNSYHIIKIHPFLKISQILLPFQQINQRGMLIGKEITPINKKAQFQSHNQTPITNFLIFCKICAKIFTKTNIIQLKERRRVLTDEKGS